MTVRSAPPSASTLDAAIRATRVVPVRPDGRVEPGGTSVYETIARLVVDAYPATGVTTPEAFTRFMERITTPDDDPVTWAVAQRGGEIAGAMRMYDYTMNVRGSDVLAGGLGTLSVGLAQKRRGVARAMVAWYVEQYRTRGAAFAVLHGFRADFYRALGFGYGTPVHRYRIAPATLRVDGARGTVRLLGTADADVLFAASERVRAKTNGLIRKHEASTRRALADGTLRWPGVFDDHGALRGFMQTSAILGPEGTLNGNELLVRDLQAEDEGFRAALFAYLRAQQDQFARIVIETQDDAFYLASDDPRASADRIVSSPGAHFVAETGLGIMYRIVDLARALATLPPFPEHTVLALEVTDPLATPLGGTHAFAFGPAREPYPEPKASPDATLRIGAADLASLVTGSLRLRDLVRHRLATVTPGALADRVAALFEAPQPPVCTTRF